MIVLARRHTIVGLRITRSQYRQNRQGAMLKYEVLPSFSRLTLDHMGLARPFTSLKQPTGSPRPLSSSHFRNHVPTPHRPVLSRMDHLYQTSVEFLQQNQQRRQRHLTLEQIQHCQYVIKHLCKATANSSSSMLNNHTPNHDREKHVSYLQVAQKLLERLERQEDQFIRDTSSSGHSNADRNREVDRILPMKSYIHVLRGWANVGTDHALDQAHTLMQRVLARHRHPPQPPSGEDMKPNASVEATTAYTGDSSRIPHSLYSSFLYACGSCRSHPQARAWANAVMEQLEKDLAEKQQQQQNGEDEKASMASFLLPLHLYNEWILVLASRASTEYGAAAQAEDLLLRMSYMAATQTSTAATTLSTPTESLSLKPRAAWTGPTTETFNRVLRAWAESPENHALLRARDILQLMLKLNQQYPQGSEGLSSISQQPQQEPSLSKPHSSGQSGLGPNPASFGTLISAHAKRREPEMAQEVWDMAWQHFNDAKLPSEQDEVVEQNDLPTSVSVSSLSSSSSLSGQDGNEPSSSSPTSKSDLQVVIDLTDCFNAALFAWVNSCRPYKRSATANEPSSVQHQESQVEGKNDHHKEDELAGDDEDNTTTHFEKAKQAVEGLFRQATTLASNSNPNNSLYRVVVQPNKRSYESYINLYLYQGQVEKADAIVRNLANEYLEQRRQSRQDKESSSPLETNQNKAMPPSTHLVRGVLQAWLRKGGTRYSSIRARANKEKIPSESFNSGQLNDTVHHEEEGSDKRAADMTSLLWLLLECFEEHHCRPDSSCAPTANLFTMCIQQCCQEHAVNDALELLKRAEELRMTHMHAYSCIVHELLLFPESKATPSSLLNTHTTSSSGRKGENALSHSDSTDFNDATNMSHSDRVFLASQLLDRMQRQKVENIQHAGTLYTLVISKLARLGTVEASERARHLLLRCPIPPTMHMFSGTLNAYIRVLEVQRQDRQTQPQDTFHHQDKGTESLVGRVLEIFDKILELDRSPSTAVEVNEMFFYTALRAIELSVLNRKKEDRPVLAENAQTLLTKMIHLSGKDERSDLKPTSRCWDAFFRIMVHGCSSPHDTVLLLHKLVHTVQNNTGGDDYMGHMPSIRTCQYVVEAWRRTNTRRGLNEVQEITQWMEANSQHM